MDTVNKLYIVGPVAEREQLQEALWHGAERAIKIEKLCFQKSQDKRVSAKNPEGPLDITRRHVETELVNNI